VTLKHHVRAVKQQRLVMKYSRVRGKLNDRIRVCLFVCQGFDQSAMSSLQVSYGRTDNIYSLFLHATKLLLYPLVPQSGSASCILKPE